MAERIYNSLWTRFRILDTKGNNKAVFVGANTKREAEGKTELACLNVAGDWATPVLGPIPYGPEDEPDKNERIEREARKLIDGYLREHYPGKYPTS